MPASWSDGYFTDTRYHVAYYPEQSPAYQRLCLLLSGHEIPYSEDGTYTCCELGFGQGLTININAAAMPGRWYGNDFNPSHVCFAEQLTRVSGSNVQLSDQSFAEYCHRDDLPMFDYVSLHGIWSWISAENRQHILHFLNTKVRPGGVVHVSYNAHPGMGHHASIRHLLNGFARISEAVQPEQRIAAALKQTQDVFAIESELHTVNPHLRHMLQTYSKMPREYLAHEFMNADWNCMFFTDVALAMRNVRLEYAARATPGTCVQGLGFSKEALDYLEGVSSPMMREQLSDIFCNTSFRHDLYMRGSLPLNMSQRITRLMDIPVILCRPADQISLEIKVGMGTVALDEETHRPVIEALATDNYRPKTLYEVQRMISSHYTEGRIVAVATALCGTGSLAFCQSKITEEAAQEACARINRHIIFTAPHTEPMEFLASPVVGFGIYVPTINLAFLKALIEGKPPVQTVFDAVQDGMPLIVDGIENPSQDEQHAALEKCFTEFKMRLPIYKALKLIKPGSIKIAGMLQP